MLSLRIKQIISNIIFNYFCTAQLDRVTKRFEARPYTPSISDEARFKNTEPYNKKRCKVEMLLVTIHCTQSTYHY